MAPTETESGQRRRRPSLGGSLDRGGAEGLEQAKKFSELSLLREDTVWRTPNLVRVTTRIAEMSCFLSVLKR